MFKENRPTKEPEAVAIFENYTTKGSSSSELIQLTSTKYEGTPVDIKAAEYGGNVSVMIWRTDNIEDVDLQIYCGAEGKISKIRIPYDKSLSSTQKDKEDETPMDSGILLIIAIGVSSIILY